MGMQICRVLKDSNSNEVWRLHDAGYLPQVKLPITIKKKNYSVMKENVTAKA